MPATAQGQFELNTKTAMEMKDGTEEIVNAPTLSERTPVPYIKSRSLIYLPLGRSVETGETTRNASPEWSDATQFALLETSARKHGVGKRDLRVPCTLAH